MKVEILLDDLMTLQKKYDDLFELYGKKVVELIMAEERLNQLKQNCKHLFEISAAGITVCHDCGSEF